MFVAGLDLSNDNVDFPGVTWKFVQVLGIGDRCRLKAGRLEGPRVVRVDMAGMTRKARVSGGAAASESPSAQAITRRDSLRRRDRLAALSVVNTSPRGSMHHVREQTRQIPRDAGFRDHDGAVGKR
jgi:hypothetical protein